MGGVKVCALASSAQIMGLISVRVKSKTIKGLICFFSAKHAAFRNKSKDLLARNQSNVSECIQFSVT